MSSQTSKISKHFALALCSTLWHGCGKVINNTFSFTPFLIGDVKMTYDSSRDRSALHALRTLSCSLAGRFAHGLVSAAINFPHRRRRCRRQCLVWPVVPSCLPLMKAKKIRSVVPNRVQRIAPLPWPSAGEAGGAKILAFSSPFTSSK